MALVSIAVVGKENEPLYLRQYPTPDPLGDLDVDARAAEAEDDEDYFGFFSEENRRDECSLRHQFILHAALDRFEELTGQSAGNRWRMPGATGSDAMWVGLLSPVEELRVYGYLTNTNIKLMGVIQDTDEFGRQQVREAELRALFAKLHELYVEYMLNPFTRIKAKIVSRRFDEGLAKLVVEFNTVHA